MVNEKIMVLIKESGRYGCSNEKLQSELTDTKELNYLIGQLVKNNKITKNGKGYWITKKNQKR